MLNLHHPFLLYLFFVLNIKQVTSSILPIAAEENVSMMRRISRCEGVVNGTYVFYHCVLHFKKNEPFDWLRRIRSLEFESFSRILVEWLEFPNTLLFIYTVRIRKSQLQ